MAEKYVSAEAAVQALRPGWRIVGREPYQVEAPNPARTPDATGKVPDITAPATVKLTIGEELSIEGPNGEPDKMRVSPPLSAADFTDPTRQSGPTVSVLEGPAKGPPTGTNKPSDPSKWTVVPRDPTNPASQGVGLWDPINNDFHPVAAPPDAKPTGVMVPAVVDYTGPDGKTEKRQVGFIDQGDNSYHPMPSPIQAQPSGVYEDQFVTNADGTKRIVGKTDTGDKSFHPIAADPTTGKQIITTPEKVFVFDANGKVINTVDIDKKSPYQAVLIDNKPYSFDPNTGKFSQAPGDWQHPPIKDPFGVTQIWQDDGQGGGKYTYPPGATGPPPVLQTNTTAKDFIWTDPVTGKEVYRTPNTNYVAPQAQLPTPSASADKILAPDPDHPGQLKWIKNEGKITASAALQAIASQLSGQVVDGNISLEDAQAIIKGANDAMATQATAASATISAINQGAVAGANLLNQRSAAAQNLVQQGMAPLGQTKHGLLVAPGADFGQNLVQGAAGFATELGGGPDVFAAAANLVRRADPNGAQGQDAATAYAALTQMFQGYRQTHGGQPHPAEVEAAQANQPGAQQANAQAFVGPQQASPWQRADQMYGTTPPGNAMALPGQAGTVPIGSPQYLGYRAPALPQAFAQSGLAEGRSVAGPSYVAPPLAPSLPQAQQVIAGGMQPITPQNRNITITVPTG